MRNYLGFFVRLCVRMHGLAWLALAVPAQSAILNVGELSLDYEAPWVRSAPADEGAEHTEILLWAASKPTLTVFVPEHRIQLRGKEKPFIQQLEQKWRAQYGANASISAMKIGEVRWNVCRRPSLEKDATVFHLVTVRNRNVYHLLVIVEGGALTLPDEAEQLIRTASWDRLRSEVMQTDSSVRKGEPSVVGLGQSMLPASMQPSVDVDAQQRPAEANARNWQLARVVYAVPSGDRLADLAARESQQLKDEGVLAGYFLKRGENQLNGGVEGYRWAPGLKQEESGAPKTPFSRRWALNWSAPVSRWQAGDPLVVKFGAAGLEPPGAASIPEAWVELIPLCGSRKAMIAVFNGLDWAEPQAEKALRQFAEACRRDAGGDSVLRVHKPLVEGGGMQLSLTPTAAWLNGVTPRNPNDVRRVALAVRFQGDASKPVVGDRLLAGATVYYIYIPEE